MIAPGERRPRARFDRSVWSATLWSLLGTLVDRVTRFAVFAMLARLIDPKQFGLVVLSLLLTETLQTVLDSNLPTALVREQELTDVKADTAFCIVLVLSGLVAAGLLWCAPLVGKYFGNSDAALLLRVLAGLPIINGVAAVPVALLKRDMRFQQLTSRNIGASLIASGVAIGLAFLGFGLWSLVARAWLQAIVMAVLAWRLAGYRPGWGFELGSIAVVRHEALRLWVAGIAGQINGRGLDLLAGLFLGAAALAAFRIAGQTVLLLIDLTGKPVMAAGFSAAARHRDDPALFERTLRSLGFMASFAIFPSFAGLLVVADPLLPMVFGDQWTIAAAITPFMCIIAPAIYWQTMASIVLFSKGHAGLLAKLSLIDAVATLVFGYVGARFGLVGFAAAGAARLYATLPISWYFVRRRAELEPRTIYTPALPCLFAALMMLGPALAAKSVLWTRLAAPRLIIVVVLVGVLSYLALVPLIVRLLGGSMSRRMGLWSQFQQTGRDGTEVERLSRGRNG